MKEVQVDNVNQDAVEKNKCRGFDPVIVLLFRYLNLLCGYTLQNDRELQIDRDLDHYKVR